jgi:hypothetical protein
MDFESPFQNLFGISKYDLKQCCRELNFEQLLFWGQALKMSFSISKFEILNCWKNLDLKIEKKKQFPVYWARASLLAHRPKPARPVHPPPSLSRARRA